MTSIYSLENAEGLDESLAIVQLINLEEETAKTGDYDQLHDREDEMIEAEKNADDEEDTTDASPEASSDEITDDSFSDTAETDTDAPSGDEDNLSELSDKKQTIASESLRNEYYDRVVLEAIEFSDITHAGNQIFGVAKDTIIGTSRLAAQLTVALYELGVKYSPGIFNVVKKAVLYLFSRSVKLFMRSTVALVDFMKQHRRSITKRLTEIEEIREEIKQLKAKASAAGKSIVLTSKTTSDDKMISWMTVSGKTDPILSVTVMEKFVGEIVSQVDKGFSNDIDAVNRLINMSKNGAGGNMFGYMAIAPFSGSFMRKAASQTEDSLLDSFVYSTVLPDQTLFVSELPKAGLQDIEQISKAYRESGVFLTSDNRHPPGVDTLDYMELAGVERFLDALESICRKAILHMDGYGRVIKASEGLKLGYRHYYQRLISDERGQSVQDTLVEYVYLKQSFAAKVYLPAAMDIRDYTASYLLRGIRLVKENLKALKVDTDTNQ